MNTPFIRNHQMNVIKKQAEFVLKTLRTVADRKVLETVRLTAVTNIFAAFPALTEEQKQLLAPVSSLETAQEFQRYLDDLEAYVVPFPAITAKQIQKLFPKTKKLKLPDLDSIDLRHVTYLGWTDIATGRLFIVYPRDGQFAGIEGRITPTNKKGYCLFCNRHQELAFFSVETKAAFASQDNIARYGHYVCLDNGSCNHSITNTEALEKFILAARKS
ncbi:FusB/FusC family EF-G-binding protein ['Paenibacillus yunnanensis' Narsing Rao et al. 2020]|uniref:FusB/FusC family EF-G-binding protein n=1 Tax=Paenibacillus tengchongensis TaxID=2608684 RepID=UPI00124CCA90|nr:FusB/FusC family EF-G-binding protein [Paenibacillus tengchongensis]